MNRALHLGSDNCYGREMQLSIGDKKIRSRNLFSAQYLYLVDNGSKPNICLFSNIKNILIKRYRPLHVKKVPPLSFRIEIIHKVQ